MREMQEQIERLKSEIERKQKGGGEAAGGGGKAPRKRGEKQTVVKNEKIQKVPKAAQIDGMTELSRW